LRCQQELIESYERLSRKLLRRMGEIYERQGVTSIALRRPPGEQRIYDMIEWCGNIGPNKDVMAEYIYRTARTINGETFEGRTTGWTWSTHGTDTVDGGSTTCIARTYTPEDTEQEKWYSLHYYSLGNTTPNCYYVMDPSAMSADWNPMHIPQLPVHSRAMLAIINIYSVGYGSSIMLLTEKEYGNTGFQTFPKVQSEGGGTSSRIVNIVLPVRTSIETMVDGSGDEGDTDSKTIVAGIPRDVLWRAIIGEYTAPTT
jgi:hypothetical protein